MITISLYLHLQCVFSFFHSSHTKILQFLDFLSLLFIMFCLCFLCLLDFAYVFSSGSPFDFLELQFTFASSIVIFVKFIVLLGFLSFGILLLSGYFNLPIWLFFVLLDCFIFCTIRSLPFAFTCLLPFYSFLKP